MQQLPAKREMNRALRSRDAGYDGVFYAGVRSTGIFCKPSCPARKPLPENIDYFRSAGDALAAGYRPCKRCRPLQAEGDMPQWARTLLSSIEEDPAARIREADLRRRGLRPAAVRRFFLAKFGMTFQALCRGQRLARAFDGIRGGSSLDDAAFDSGFESLSGFRDAFAKYFRTPPGKSGGHDYVSLAWMDTPVGPMIAGAAAAGICLLEFSTGRLPEAWFEGLAGLFRSPLIAAEQPLHKQLRSELAEYFAGKRTSFSLPLVYPGSEFQVRVWEALRRIPYGRTKCYGDIAQEIGCSGAVRAVGRANGQNRISILIPCHRVVNKSGELGGYGGGLWRKRYLLDLEKGRAGKE